MPCPFEPSRLEPKSPPRPHPPAHFRNLCSSTAPSKASLKSCPLEMFVRFLTPLIRGLLITSYTLRLLRGFSATRSADGSSWRRANNHTNQHSASSLQPRRRGRDPGASGRRRVGPGLRPLPGQWEAVAGRARDFRGWLSFLRPHDGPGRVTSPKRAGNAESAAHCQR